MFKDPITTLASDNSLLKLVASIPSLQNYKLYSQDTNNTKFPKFADVLKETKSELQPDWVVKSSFDGSTCETKINFINTYSHLKPTFIFQHGLLITNHRANLDAVISKSFYKDFNIVSIKAAWHQNPVVVVTEALSSFRNSMLMLASSVHAIEEVCKFHKKISKQKLIVCGTSMGGITATNHFFYYNTADSYFPIVAYPNFARLILSPKYNSLFYDFKQMADNSSYLTCMDISDSQIQKANKAKIFPILGTLDETVPFADAKAFWEKFLIQEYPAGHFDIVKYAKSIRQYILDTTNDSFKT